ncbi:MAG: hypothetical protein USCAAHI_00504 [Beijerinckiaceae bacterium]|nr:MAG: hypothetical protein USCAAHI_00504 [Beijerinckiaceae bacterium]
MTRHGNGVDRLGQSIRAGDADSENRVDFPVLDRPGEFRDADRDPLHRGRGNVILSERRVQKKLIVRLSRRNGLQNANPMPAQIVDRMQPALRRREHHGRVPAHDQNSLAARWHRDIAAHDREIGMTFLEHA